MYLIIVKDTENENERSQKNKNNKDGRTSEENKRLI